METSIIYIDNVAYTREVRDGRWWLTDAGQWQDDFITAYEVQRENERAAAQGEGA